MKKVNLLILMIFMFISFSCGPGGGGTTTGNPVTVKMEFAAYNNSLARQISNFFIPEAHAALASLKMCFKRVRFKPQESSIGDNVDLELGEIEIKQEGTPLSDVSIPEGLYKRVEFDLAKDCDNTTKDSVTVANDNGTFTSQDTITVKFEGEFRPSDGDLTLFVQNIVDVVKDYQASDGELKNVLEGVSGTF